MVESCDKRGYYKLGRVTETIKGSDGMNWSATIQTENGVYMGLVVMLAPVLQSDEDALTLENKAGDVEAELSQYA